MIPSTVKELARITALEELVDTANATIYKLTTELDTERQRNQQLVTENARLRALLNAQDEYAHSGAYAPLVKTEFMEDGD